MAAEKVRIEITRGDITAQPDIDAVVNAANAELLPGGGVAGAIHAAAGPDLRRACEPLAPIEPGQAVITEAFGLPNRYVIHVLGPRYGIDEPAAELLAACFERAIALAEERELGSIAFPAISTGTFGYPLEEAAPVALEAVQRAASAARSLRFVRFVLYGEHDLRAFRQAWSEGSEPQR